MNARNELREYLGQKWEPQWTVWNADKLNKEVSGYADWWDFYRRSKYAVYLLANAIVDEWREPHLTFVRETMRACPVLDYHAGVGGFSLRLYDGYGYEPAFADYQTKSIPFLKWRLKKRGLKADVWDLDKNDLPSYPLVICFDAIERYGDTQAELIDRLAELGQTVVVSADSRYVDVAAVLAHIGERLMKHKVVNVYVNLIAYKGLEQEVE